jgi:hypothetical protein
VDGGRDDRAGGAQLPPAGDPALPGKGGPPVPQPVPGLGLEQVGPAQQRGVVWGGRGPP